MSYVPMILTAAVVILAVQLAPHASNLELSHVRESVVDVVGQFRTTWPILVTIAALTYLLLHFRSRPVYLLDFACFDPPDSWKYTHEGAGLTVNLTSFVDIAAIPTTRSPRVGWNTLFSMHVICRNAHPIRLSWVSGVFVTMAFASCGARHFCREFSPFSLKLPWAPA